MADDPQFEDRLREALRRDATDIPFRLDALTVRERMGTRSRLPGWLLPIALPIGAAVVLAILVLNAFPGQSLEPGIGPGATATTSTEPTARPSTASPAPATPQPTLHPGAREDAATATADGRLYLIGGRAHGGLTSVVVFDGRVWTDMTPLPESRRGAAAALLPDGRLLVAGGERDGEPLDSTLILTPDGNAWAEGPDMPYAQAYMGTVTIDGLVYLFGGSVPERADDVLIFDSAAETWNSGTPMPIAGSRIAVAAADGAAYLFGGRAEPDGGGLVATMRYDPVADSWQTLANMPGVGTGVSATVVGRQVWILGELIPDEPVPLPEEGATRNGVVPSMAWVYELDADSWSDRVSTDFWPGSWHAALLQTNGRILIIGGWPNLMVDTVDTTAP